MDRPRRPWVVVGGAIVVAGLTAILLGISSLDGFANPSGDLITRPLSGSTIATLLVGTLALLALETAHLARRRPGIAGVVRARGRPGPVLAKDPSGNRRADRTPV
jgi:hypothetical protein